MWLERAAPRNHNVLNAQRVWTENDTIYCQKQGKLFMEAAAMGFPMSSFVPLYMTSQLAGVIDYNFSSSNGVGSALEDLLQMNCCTRNMNSLH